MDLFALATLPPAADEAGGPPSIKFYEPRDKLDAGLRRGERPGWTGGMYSFMRRVLATPHGHDLYRQRQITIEPVFGQIKFNRAIKRFQRRGRTACRSEWRFIAASHNVLKLHHHRLAAATT